MRGPLGPESSALTWATAAPPGSNPFDLFMAGLATPAPRAEANAVPVGIGVAGSAPDLAALPPSRRSAVPTAEASGPEPH